MKRSVLGAFLWGITTVAVATPMVMAPETAFAAKEKKEKPATRRAKTLSAKVFEQVEKSQECLSNGDHACAAATLQKLLSNSKRLDGYERAVINQQMGYVFADQERYSEAIPYFQRALDSGELNQQLQLQLMFNVAQLYMAMEQYTRAIGILEEWFRLVEEPTGQSYIVMANAYALVDQYQRALPFAEKGYALATEPREDWSRLLLAIYLELKSWNKALNLLENQLVVRWPDRKNYWTNLVGLYGQLNRDKDSYLTLRIMREQSMLSGNTELVQLAQMHMYYEVPFYAGVLLEGELERGRVNKTDKNYELLANAWYQSREWTKAIPAMRQAAQRSGEGNLFVRLGSAYVQEEDWKRAETALVRGLNKGKLDDAGQAWILLGYSRLELEKFDESKEAFEKAVRFSDSRETAERYIRYVEQQISRRDAELELSEDELDEELEEAMPEVPEPVANEEVEIDRAEVEAPEIDGSISTDAE